VILVKKVLILAIAISLVLGMVQLALAAPAYLKAPYGKVPYRYGIGNPMFRGQNLIRLLDLTDEQIGKIKELRERYYNRLKELWNKLQDALFSLKQLQLEKEPDKSLLDKQREEIKERRKELRSVFNEYWKEFKSILTNEQISRLNKMRTAPPYRYRRAPGSFHPYFRW